MKKLGRPDEMTRYEWSVSRWISSETRLSLDPAGRGIYRDLLDLCYMTGSIPADIGLLCRLTNSTAEEMERTWSVIKRHFPVDKNNPTRCVNLYANVIRKHYFLFLNEQRVKATKNRKKSTPLNPNESNEIHRVGSATAKDVPEQWLSQRERERERERESISPPTPSSEGESVKELPLVTRQRKWFEEFWSEVWLKVGKDGVWSKFQTKVKDEKTFAEVMAGVRRDAPIQRARERRYVVHPKTWLNEGRWKDEDDAAPLFVMSGPPPAAVMR